MPGVNPVTALVLPLTGPWQVRCGPASASYHQLPLCPSRVSVVVVSPTADAVKEGASVVNVAAATASALAQPFLLYAVQV